jgi:surface protein
MSIIPKLLNDIVEPVIPDIVSPDEPATILFTSTWQTDNPGTSTSTQITLPLESTGTYNFTVDWGDGNSDTITIWNQAEVTHDYGVGNEGSYVVTIDGTIDGWRFNNGGDKDKITNISKWGSLKLGNAGSYFFGCSNITITATDVLDLTGTTTLFSTFRSCTSLTTVPSINSWATSGVTTFEAIFRDSTSFNQNLDSLDVSGATNIASFFRNIASFNQPVGSWDTSSVQTALSVFDGASSFNQPLDSWDVSSVTNMNAIFRGASSFNQPLNSWDITSVGTLRNVFRDASSFNQPLNNWDVSAVTNCLDTFNGASSFDQDLSSWDVGSAINLSRMLLDSAFSRTNYDLLLVAWDALTLQSGVSFHAGTAQYSQGAPATARANIISGDSWTITDGGVAPGFFSNWTTSNAGVTNNDQILLPLESTGTYNFIVEWGDGNSDNITAWDQAETTHTYAAPGTYTIRITGTIDGWRFNNGGDKDKIIDILQWGDLKLGNSSSNFFGCSNLTITATDVLDTNGKANWSNVFRNCSSLTTVPSINSWDMSTATNISSLFRSSAFNDDISGWDVSNVTNMATAFFVATSFDQPIGSWNTSSVTNMSEMFRGASSFNQSLSLWDTSSVTAMAGIFFGAFSFNGSLSLWNTTNVLNLQDAFRDCSAFNQDISAWDVQNVSNFQNTFRNCSSFNQPLNSWDTSSATTLIETFFGCSVFNQDLSSWDTSSVTNMIRTFYNCTNFDQSLAGWDVSNVTNMAEMLRFSAFSQTSYDPTLIAWDLITLQNSVNFHAGTAKYGAGAPATARANIISTYSWTITDGGAA